MAIPDPATLLAGFVLAHAAWNVSDLPKDALLCPLAIVEKDGKRQLFRYEAPTQAEAIAHGKSAMVEATKSADAWAFARDGLLPEGGKKVDVLLVDFWAKGMTAPVTLVQKYEPFARSGAFKVIGAPVVVIGGVEQKPEQVKELLQVVWQGVSQHPKAGSLWDGWQSK